MRIETMVDDTKASAIIMALNGDNNIHGKIFTFDTVESHDL